MTENEKGMAKAFEEYRKIKIRDFDKRYGAFLAKEKARKELESLQEKRRTLESKTKLNDELSEEEMRTRARFKDPSYDGTLTGYEKKGALNILTVRSTAFEKPD